jgi:AcrR family transcriptional regulator
VGEILDRRARKKAQTRTSIRSVAHHLFDTRGFESVTIADVAREADVAVQTVFNHFATKEELFFDGRIPCVDGPAEAVRSRPAGTSPLTALRVHLVRGAGHFVALHLSPQGRSLDAAVDECPALATYEQRIIHEAEQRLACALAEAWATDPEPGAVSTPPLATPELAAPLTAAIWLATTRVVVVEQRRTRAQHADRAGDAAAVECVADAVLAGIQSARAARQAG